MFKSVILRNQKEFLSYKINTCTDILKVYNDWQSKGER